MTAVKFGEFLRDVFGGGGARRAGGTMRRQKTGHRKRSGALSRRKSLPTPMQTPARVRRRKKQNRMIPRFSGIRHAFGTRTKTYLPVCGVPRRETPTQLQRFWSVYSPHPQKRTPQTAKYAPGAVSSTRGHGYSFSIFLINSLISDSKSVNPISRTMTSQYPGRYFRK